VVFLWGDDVHKWDLEKERADETPTALAGIKPDRSLLSLTN
jgi:hypothetical protein